MRKSSHRSLGSSPLDGVWISLCLEGPRLAHSLFGSLEVGLGVNDVSIEGHIVWIWVVDGVVLLLLGLEFIASRAWAPRVALHLNETWEVPSAESRLSIFLMPLRVDDVAVKLRSEIVESGLGWVDRGWLLELEVPMVLPLGLSDLKAVEGVVDVAVSAEVWHWVVHWVELLLGMLVLSASSRGADWITLHLDKTPNVPDMIWIRVVWVLIVPWSGSAWRPELSTKDGFSAKESYQN